MTWAQLPNIITSLRLILLVPLSYYLIKQDYQPALIIFFIAGFSDALDGFLAKRYNWVSRFGSILDPIADKALLVLTMAILTLNDKISLLLFVVVAIRDFYIMAGAFYYYRKIGPFQMQPSGISKFNTFAQIVMVTLILVSQGTLDVPAELIQALVISVYFSVIVSSVHYTIVWFKKYMNAIKLNNKSEI